MISIVQIVKAIFLFILIAATCHGYKPPKSAIVINADTHEVLHEEKADELRHPASLTKKMTLYILFQALKAGSITLDTHFIVSSRANRQAPSKLGIASGQSVSVETIIKSLVTKSANDMAVVAAEGEAGSYSAFIAKMNQTARALGMTRTTFYNPSGLPDGRQWTTARDMAILGHALYRDFPEYWNYFELKYFAHSGKTHKNHNRLLFTVPGVNGIKTGFTNASGFNVSTSAVRYTPEGHPVRLFVVVMGGDTRHQRDKRVADLMSKYFTKTGATRFAPSTTQMVSRPAKKGEVSDVLDTSLIDEAVSDSEATARLEQAVFGPEIMKAVAKSPTKLSKISFKKSAGVKKTSLNKKKQSINKVIKTVGRAIKRKKKTQMVSAIKPAKDVQGAQKA